MLPHEPLGSSPYRYPNGGVKDGSNATEWASWPGLDPLSLELSVAVSAPSNEKQVSELPSALMRSEHAHSLMCSEGHAPTESSALPTLLLVPELLLASE